MGAPLCIDCRHCSKPMMAAEYLCVRPISNVSGARSPVHGGLTRKAFLRCETERRGHRTLTGRFKCGPGGSCFVAKDPRKPPTQGSSVQPPPPAPCK